MEGPCPIAEEMSICIENDSPLPIVLTEKDDLAVAVDSEDLPTLDACARVQARREKFYAMLDWNGGGEDVVKIVDCPKQEKTIVGVIHRIPRFSSMKIEELPEEYRKQVMGCQATRITTLTYENGEVDYVVEEGEQEGLPQWTKGRPWCGQTSFALNKNCLLYTSPSPRD